MLANRTTPYLRALAALCLEAARHPELLCTLLRILRIAPKTIAELAGKPLKTC
jgi:hypothetical protein